MNTQNLNLEEINLNDTINSTMLQKINNNMRKIDEKYGELKNKLLETTGQETIEDALAYVEMLVRG